MRHRPLFFVFDSPRDARDRTLQRAAHAAQFTAIERTLVSAEGKTPEPEVAPLQLSRGDVVELPLGRKLPLLISGLILFVLLASSGAAYLEVDRSATSTANDRVTSLAKQLAGLVTSSVSSRAMDEARGERYGGTATVARSRHR